METKERGLEEEFKDGKGYNEDEVDDEGEFDRELKDKKLDVIDSENEEEEETEDQNNQNDNNNNNNNELGT